MMAWISITHAHEYWDGHRHLLNPPSNFDEAEAFILSAPPNTMQEAACILDVICAYAFDARCDGLDLVALRRVRTLLAAA